MRSLLEALNPIKIENILKISLASLQGIIQLFRCFQARCKTNYRSCGPPIRSSEKESYRRACDRRPSRRSRKPIRWVRRSLVRFRRTPWRPLSAPRVRSRGSASNGVNRKRYPFSLGRPAVAVTILVRCFRQIQYTILKLRNKRKNTENSKNYCN